jgi:hypothetical protein
MAPLIGATKRRPFPCRMGSDAMRAGKGKSPPPNNSKAELFQSNFKEKLP